MPILPFCASLCSLFFLVGTETWRILFLTLFPIHQSARVWTVDAHVYVSSPHPVCNEAFVCVRCKATMLNQYSASVSYIFFRVEQGKELELKDHTQSVEGLSWHPKHAEVLATISTDKNLRIWDIRSKCNMLKASDSQSKRRQCSHT